MSRETSNRPQQRRVVAGEQLESNVSIESIELYTEDGAPIVLGGEGGVEGDKGPTGDKGPDGDQGPVGDKGPDGDPGAGGGGGGAGGGQAVLAQFKDPGIFQADGEFGSMAFTLEEPTFVSFNAFWKQRYSTFKMQYYFDDAFQYEFEYVKDGNWSDLTFLPDTDLNGMPFIIAGFGAYRQVSPVGLYLLAGDHEFKFLLAGGVSSGNGVEEPDFSVTTPIELPEGGGAENGVVSTAAEPALKIVRGWAYTDSVDHQEEGEGWSASAPWGNGYTRVVFDEPFSDRPVVTLTPNNNNSGSSDLVQAFIPNYPETTHVDIRAQNADGSPAGSEYISFIAIGPA